MRKAITMRKTTFISADHARWVRQRLQEIDVPPPAGGRFDRMLAALETATPINILEHLDELVRAEKDVLELDLILRTLATTTLDSKVRSRIRQVVEHDPLSPAGKANSPGRDLQFELLIEAILTRAGMRPRYIDIPGHADFVVSAFERDYAVEVKRLKSTGMVLEAFGKACKQIAATGLVGFVMMDLGPALHAGSDAIPEPQRDSEYRETATAELR